MTDAMTTCKQGIYCPYQSEHYQRYGSLVNLKSMLQSYAHIAENKDQNHKNNHNYTCFGAANVETFNEHSN